MDYGYQLLRHVLQQVFGNLGQAARLTLPLFAVPYLFLLFFAGLTPGMEAQPGRVNLPFLVLGAVLMVLCYCWAAVVWHRYVLLEEAAPGLLPDWKGAFVGRYFWAAVKITLIMAGAGLLLVFPVLAIVAVTQQPGVAVFLAATIGIGGSWLATRIGLILPAAALGAALGIGESWRVTRPVSGQILLPLIVISVASAILTGLVGLVFGAGLLAAMTGALVTWLQILVNLALMTTLYGNLIEGRALN